MVEPSQVVATVRTRSPAYLARYSLGWAPPSRVTMFRRLKPLAPGIQGGEDEGVDRVLDPGRLPDRRDCGTADRLVGPVGLILSSLGDPSTEELLLGNRQLLGRAGRGHDFFRVFAQDPGDQL